MEALMKRICCFLFIIGFTGVASGSMAAGASRGNALWQASPRDIRDIFLSVPLPANDLEIFQGVFADAAHRKELLQKTDFTSGKSVLDIAGGYLRIEASVKNDAGSDSQISIVLTYFTKGNSDRLVVLQLGDLSDYPDPVLIDTFYLLAAGQYTEEPASNYLPPITFFGDFWGNQPLPDEHVREYVKLQKDASFYMIEWPRKGTVAKATGCIPYSDTDSKEMEMIQGSLAKRQYKDLELIWDKNKGAFSKGAKTLNH
jgi:hypothetical protein